MKNFRQNLKIFLNSKIIYNKKKNFLLYNKILKEGVGFNREKYSEISQL